MITDNKLLPKAYTIANNLKEIKLNTSGSYRMNAKKKSKWQNPIMDAVNFLASVYAKELKVADFNAIWNKRLVDGEPQKDQFVVVQSSHYKTVNTIVAFSETEWDQLQITISKLFNIIYPFKSLYSGVYTNAELNTIILPLMGIYFGGNPASLGLFDANGNLIGTFGQGIAYARNWNDLKVPIDAALGVETPFLAPIYQPTGETNWFYRYTGKRRWSDNFEGYDSY